jgi:hypothetical protein
MKKNRGTVLGRIVARLLALSLAQRHSGGGAASPGSSSDETWQGRRHEHRWGGGNTPNKVAAVRAHPSGGSTVRCDGDG